MHFFTRVFALTLWSSAWGFIPKNASRQVDALWDLEEVAECVLQYSAFTYNNYGCWCGVGGAHKPVDGIDDFLMMIKEFNSECLSHGNVFRCLMMNSRCCMRHDKCYDAAIDKKICLDVPFEYVDPYAFICRNRQATCEDQPPTCKSALCACDVAVVNCWSQYPRPTAKARCNHVDRAFGTQ